MPDTISYRQAQPDDLPGIAAVFLAAFPESVRHYVGHEIPPLVIEDMFAIMLATEPEAIFVAVRNDRIDGYIVAPTRLSGIVRAARRRLWRMAARWVTGRYHLELRPVWVALRNALLFLHDARQDDDLASDARIFSVAVHPDAQGRGVGGGLMSLGLHYLVSRRVNRVRLEVRPGNMPGVHLYQKMGFVIRGRTRDTQGEWLIMLKEDGMDASVG